MVTGLTATWICIGLDKSDIPGAVEEAECAYFRGLACLVGDGLLKNVGLGLAWVTKAASGGCMRARAIVRRLCATYQRSLDEEDEILRQWFLDGSLCDPETAIQGLRSLYPSSRELQQATERSEFSYAF